MMIQDDEFDVHDVPPERVEALGFKPQKELLINHLLPYSDELDQESSLFLAQIKENFAKAVMLREMKPGCGVWSARLMKYIRMYGMKFSKEDHIKFIKLAYELTIIPDLEPSKIQKFATLFLMLTKTRHLISPEEMTLPWRPLYDLKRRIFDKSTSQIGMYHYLTTLEASVMTMVKAAKVYFDVSATKEILAEFLPQINPWSSDSQALNHMVAFLPVGLRPEDYKHGHELWFTEMMHFWDQCHNLSNGSSDIMALFASLAKGSPGAVDWAPYHAKMFTKFLHSLHLPVSYKDMQFSRNFSLNMKHVASWIVWCIKPDGVVLKHLRSFLAAIDSYLQSANQGRWSMKIRDLLKKLCKEFLERVRREREKKLLNCWMNQTPEEMRLRDSDITEFVSVMVEPVLAAVYSCSRSGSVDVSGALLALSTLRPALVVPRLVLRLTDALTSLTEPHRATAALAALAAVARPMLRAVGDYPAGPTHAVPLLTAVLPGLDPNDLKKSFLTLQFILLFAWCTPIVDCSSAHLYWDDLTDEELLTCESTAQFEDFVLLFLDRIFIIIESSVTENVRLDTKETDCVRSKTDAAMETALYSASKAVLMQCSPKIFKEALRKFTNFAMNSTFEANVSGSMVGMLLGVFARVDAAHTVEAVLPELSDALVSLLRAEDARAQEPPPRPLLYRLVLLHHLLDADPAVLTAHLHLLTPVLDLALKLHSTTALTRSCDILARLFTSLSTINLKEWRSSPHDYSTAPEKWLPIREWGKGCLLKDVKLQWHVPGKEEAQCCQMLTDRYLEPEVRRLEQWLSGEREMCRERMTRAFLVVTAALAGGGTEPAAGQSLVASVVPGGELQPASGEQPRPLLRGRQARPQLAELFRRVQERLLEERGEQARALELLARVWERVAGVRQAAAGEGRARALVALERALDAHGGQANSAHHTARLRMLLADVARLHDEARHELACEVGPAPHVLTALHCLYDLSLNQYTLVRVLAQSRLYGLLSQHAYSYRAITGRLRDTLAEGAAVRDGEPSEAGEARLKGALYLLVGPRTAPLVAKHDWAVARELWPAVLKSPISEKPSIIELEHAFSETLHHHFPSVNTRLTMTQGAIDAARALLTEEQLKDESFVQLLAESVERERQNNTVTEQLYVELANEIADVLGGAGTVWRRAELGAQLLACCPSPQTRYPPPVVRAVLPALLHPDIAVRRLAARLSHFVIKQRKIRTKKIFVDPYQVAGVPRPTEPVRGYRQDLEWVMWTDAEVLQTDEEWDQPWIKNSNVGFYTWPEKLEVPAPSSQQSFVFDMAPEDMEEGQRFIYEFFTNEENIEKLVKFLTVEEKKGKDKFSGIRFGMFRVLFANFGEVVADRLLVAALQCAKSEQEAPQRFAGEVAAAALRAARQWRREQARRMQQRALDVLSAGLAAVSPDTADEWGTALATAFAKQCPRRVASVLAALRALCLPAAAPREQVSSFAVCARLYALQGALGSLSWRAAPLANKILRQLDDDDFTQHPYQNVREIVGSMLMTIFDTELVLLNSESDHIPCLKSYLITLKPRLAALYDVNGDIIVKTSTSPLQVQCETQEVSSTASPEPAVELPMIGEVRGLSIEAARLSPEREEAAAGALLAAAAGALLAAAGSSARGEAAAVERALAGRLEAALRLAGDGAAPQGHATAVQLLTTLLRAVMGVIVRAVGTDTDTLYTLVGTACALTTRGTPTPHDELPRAADGFLASLARLQHDVSDFYTAMNTIEKLADARSWWARLSCVQFAQPLFFYGLPILCAKSDCAERAEKFAMKLMRDPRIEVRQAAAKLLTGLMHCNALPDEEKTVKKLIRSSRSKDIVEKHCGVLGLCAYLASRPYSVGPLLGATLEALAAQASAPDPVPAAIRAALADFRRTHHDDWPRHRALLTQDELDLLADLTSPPSYFA